LDGYGGYGGGESSVGGLDGGEAAPVEDGECWDEAAGACVVPPCQLEATFEQLMAGAGDACVHGKGVYVTYAGIGLCERFVTLLGGVVRGACECKPTARVVHQSLNGLGSRLEIDGATPAVPPRSRLTACAAPVSKLVKLHADVRVLVVGLPCCSVSPAGSRLGLGPFVYSLSPPYALLRGGGSQLCPATGAIAQRYTTANILHIFRCWQIPPPRLHRALPLPASATPN